VASVEDRIVSIKFDNAQFEQKIAATAASLDTLSKKIDQVAAGKSFEGLNTAANNVNLAPIANGVDNISSKFNAMGAVAFTAIQNVTTSLMGMAKGFVQTDILAPLITGGKTRSEALDQAKFQFRGLGMDVDAVMADAKQAVLGTAYGLGDAASAAAQFGASGIKQGADMVQSLQAIAGTAAMTGRSYGEMAMIFTSSAASGKVTNMDLLQFSTRGLNAAAAYAKQNGITEASVHDMATAGTLDYASFAKAMDNAFGSHSTQANETYKGSLDNLHAAMSRLSASFFTPEMEQQRNVFNALTPVVDALAKAMNPLIIAILLIRQHLAGNLITFLDNIDMAPLKEAFTSFGTVVINVFKLVEQIFGTFKAAFKEIFPGNAILSVALFADKLAVLSSYLKMGAETAEKVKSMFAGFFAVVSIGWAILKGIAVAIGEVISSLAPAGGNFLKVGAGIGDFLVKAKELLVDGGKIHDFFVRLGEVIVAPIQFIERLAAAIVSFFTKIVGASSDTPAKKFDSIGDAANRASSIWETLTQKLQGVMTVLDKVWNAIATWFSQLGDKIAAELKGTDFNSALDVLNVALLGGITAMISKFMTGGVKFGLQGGLFTTIQSNLKQVTNSLKLMETSVKAEAILKIAAALGIITISMIALSMVDSQKLGTALIAMAVGFGELAGTFMALDNGVDGSLKLSIISTALIAMAIAMDILASAIVKLSKLSPGELAKGLIGVAVGIGILVGAVNLIPDAPHMIAAGVAMGAMAIAMLILSEAVKSFASMSWGEMAKGLIGVSVGLTAIVLAMNNMPPTSVLTGVSFIAIAVGLMVLAEAVKMFGSMPFGEMVKGLLGISIALAAVTIAMNFMPPDMPAMAFGLLIVAGAMIVMANAVKEMGSMSFETLAKGLGAIAIALLILVVAMNEMQGSIAGAFALVVVSGALLVLANVMEQLGKLSIAQIVTSLAAIAGVLIVLGVAAALMSEVIPALLGLGVALALIGGAFALFGLGVLAVAVGLTILATVGPAAMRAFVSSLDILIQAMPKLAAGAALFVANFVEELLRAAPVFLKLFTALMEQLLDTVIKLAPKIGKAFEVIITVADKVIRDKFPEMVKTGFAMLIAFLQGISDNIGKIVDLASSIISGFINGIANNLPQLVGAAANLLISFLNELANHAVELVAAGLNVITQIINGISQGIVLVVDAVGNLIIAFITAVGNKLGDIVTAGVNTVLAFLAGLAANALALASGAAQVLIQFLNGLADAINTYAPQIRAAGQRVGSAIINGIVPGFSETWHTVTEWLGDMGQKVSDACRGAISWLTDIGRKIITGLWDGMKAIWHDVTGWLGGLGDVIKSVKGPPEKDAVMLVENGMLIMSGLHVGLKTGWSAVSDWLSSLNPGDSFNQAIYPQLQSAMSKIPDMLSNMTEFNPTITPVLDLTKVKMEAKDIAGYMGVSSLTPNVSSSQANVISASTSPTSNTTDTMAPAGPTSVTFQQTINAPTELSTNDIYRSTKSQFALAKGELGL